MVQVRFIAKSTFKKSNHNQYVSQDIKHFFYRDLMNILNAFIEKFK